MPDTSEAELGVRVERGQANADELAALTVALLAVRARGESTIRRTSGARAPRWWRPSGA
ncbi:acyl-CoA carboxylase epsilon subunit [Streptomyces sp. N35]|uniref:acyl-CoA carboxylase epsilon subunit n=1 Tax=Streptomyces sp. N35 TaxID=2795730 RepID=UPI0018F596DA|nr:acyl-CoA carboxylase epsilon subunit [Streptomyces sp. N35]